MSGLLSLVSSSSSSQKVEERSFSEALVEAAQPGHLDLVNRVLALPQVAGQANGINLQAIAQANPQQQ